MSSLVSSLNMPVRHNEHYGTVMCTAGTPQSRSRAKASTCREHKKAAGQTNDRRFQSRIVGSVQPTHHNWCREFGGYYSLAAEQGLQGLHAAFFAAAHGLQAPQAAFFAAAHGLQAPQAALHGLHEAYAGASLTTGDRTTAPAARPRTTGRAAAPDRSLDLCIFMSVFSTLGFAGMAVWYLTRLQP